MNANRIPYLTIVAAKSGDSEAMTTILIHFAPYIRRYSKRTFYDEYGNHCEFVDDEIRQRIEVKLMMGSCMYIISNQSFILFEGSILILITSSI